MSPRVAAPFTPKTQTAKRICDFFEGKNFVEISKQTSITDRQIGGYLKGENPPSTKLLEYIARNGGDVNYILTGERKNPTAHDLTPAQKLVLSHLKTLFDMLLETYHQALADPKEAEEIADFFENIASTLTRKAQ